MQGDQPPLLESVPLSLANDGLSRVFRINKAFILPFVLTSLHSCFQVSNLISLCEVQARARFRLSASANLSSISPSFVHLCPSFLCQRSGLLGCLGHFLSILGSFSLVLRHGHYYIIGSLFSLNVLGSLPQPPVNKMGQLCGLIA